MKSWSEVRIQTQKGKNDPQQEISFFNVLNVLFGVQNIAIIDQNFIIY